MAGQSFIHADEEQLRLARNLLGTVRHAAYATVNEDGTPHNSPLMLIYDERLTTLYVGSYSESRHCRNFLRTGTAFAVLFDSFTKGQGGVYVTAGNARECSGTELEEALRVHNATRARRGSEPIELAYYLTPKPAQRMYALDITKIEIYSIVRDDEGFIKSEARVPVAAQQLLGT
ncbi:pyridoxamine 5'-phosphate oxidase family protein [Candidatus Saccharibacteria bacterium]|nr:pyridoxamine 5'-phosphate oxidase family protein [Candidatus Saccharibacteria bacterium]